MTSLMLNCYKRQCWTSGLITAHELNVENGEVEGYSGTRSGNTGSVTPFDDSGPYLDFEIKSATELTATVTKCNNCAADDAAKTPPGKVVPITRVTNQGKILPLMRCEAK